MLQALLDQANLTFLQRAHERVPCLSAAIAAAALAALDVLDAGCRVGAGTVY
jgi:hypothetical protein